MHQHVDGNAADRVEGVQYPERFGGAEAKNVFALANHSESLKRWKEKQVEKERGQTERHRLYRPDFSFHTWQSSAVLLNY